MSKTKDKQITKQVENHLPEPQLIERRPIEIPTELGAIEVLTPMERLERNKELITVLSPIIQDHHLANIQGKNYMCVGGGIAVANSLGYAISVSAVTHDKGMGVYQATSELRDSNTGVLVATAVGYVGDDEKRWVSGPKYALLSMTQTRAEAKLLRANFGSVYVMLGASSDTPAEEMSGVTNGRPAPKQAEPPAPSAKKSFSSGGDDWADQKADIQVDHVSHFNEPNKEPGEGWVLHLIHDMDETVFSTFDDEIKESAIAAIGTKKIIAITFKQKGDKRRLTGWDTIPF
jgi:hypothetical protein